MTRTAIFANLVALSLSSLAANAYADAPARVRVELSGFDCLANAGTTELEDPSVALVEYGGFSGSGDTRETCGVFVAVKMIPGWKFRVVQVRYNHVTGLGEGSSRTIDTSAHFQGSASTLDYATTLTGPAEPRPRTAVHKATSEFSKCGGGRALVFNPSLSLEGDAESEITSAEIELEWQRCQ